MNRLLFFFVIFFALVISEKAFCASSDWLESTYNKTHKSKGDSFIDTVDTHSPPDLGRSLLYYQEKSKEVDWSKLRMVFNAKEYDLNESIYVRFFLKNMSDDDQLYSMTYDQFGSRLKLLIFYENDTPIEKIQKEPEEPPLSSSRPRSMSVTGYIVTSYKLLRPGRETEINHLFLYTPRHSFYPPLEELYPLTRPGKYRVTASFGEVQAEPVEFVIRDRQYEPPSNPIEPKDQWGNDFFYNTKFRLAFDPSKNQHCFNPDEPIDLLLYTIDHALWWRTPPPKNNVPLFALDKIPYRGVRLVLFTPEGWKVSKVLSSPGDVPDTFAELNEGILNLRKVFDLTTPGKYRLSGDLRSVRPAQQFVPPLESNEIEFEIEGDF